MLSSNVPEVKAPACALGQVCVKSAGQTCEAQETDTATVSLAVANAFRARDLSKTIDIDVPEQLAFHQTLKKLSDPFVDLICSVIESPANWRAFATCPSSVRGHHSNVGGNLRHTLEVAQSCMDLASPHSAYVDMEVLLTAALLHDFGKIRCYKAGEFHQWNHTDENRLLGHKLLGTGPVVSHINRSSEITPVQKLGLMHCLVASNAHSGDSRGPACLEAEILMRADQLSALADLYRESSEASCGRAGFGLRHPHQRQVPFHIKGSPPSGLQKRNSRFGDLVIRTRGAL